MNRKLSRLLIAIAALLLATATALGAAASHALETLLDAAALDAFRTAVEYQFVHSLGLMAVAIHAERRTERKRWIVAALLLFGGIVLFCGGVYSSSLDGPRWISALAPAGGISLITGWLVVAAAVLWPQFAAGSDNT